MACPTKWIIPSNPASTQEASSDPSQCSPCSTNRVTHAYLQSQVCATALKRQCTMHLDCKVSRLWCRHIVMHACRLCSLMGTAFADLEAAAQGMTFVHSHNSRPSVSLDNFAKVVTRFLVSTVVSLFLACPGILLNNIHDAACLYDCSEVVGCVLNLQQKQWFSQSAATPYVAVGRDTLDFVETVQCHFTSRVFKIAKARLRTHLSSTTSQASCMLSL